MDKEDTEKLNEPVKKLNSSSVLIYPMMAFGFSLLGAVSGIFYTFRDQDVSVRKYIRRASYKEIVQTSLSLISRSLVYTAIGYSLVGAWIYCEVMSDGDDSTVGFKAKLRKRTNINYESSTSFEDFWASLENEGKGR